MPDSLQCYRCGNSLDALTLPISREDQCPSCTVYVHCCRMCAFYEPAIAEQCREDDAEEVKNKENANFCDYFRPAAGMHDPVFARQDRDARAGFDTLFGEGPDDDGSDTDDSGSAADDLFR
ncbi:MAG: hypothetical protein E2O52_10070 [Gammaproteobacteria bacterium]|nr:MAG: hypothetical protein E2O52_10070 [Gammaproteobacteria bacterium]